MNYDITRYEIIKYLPVSSILHLCFTDKSLYQICQDNSLWIYLLQREFNYEYNDTKAYELYTEIYKGFILLKLDYSSIINLCGQNVSFCNEDDF